MGGENEAREDQFSFVSFISCSFSFCFPFSSSFLLIVGNQVIVRTYQRQRSLLPALIASLASSEYPNMHIYLVDTQGDFADLPKFKSM